MIDFKLDYGLDIQCRPFTGPPLHCRFMACKTTTVLLPPPRSILQKPGKTAVLLVLPFVVALISRVFIQVEHEKHILVEIIDSLIHRQLDSQYYLSYNNNSRMNRILIVLPSDNIGFYILNVFSINLSHTCDTYTCPLCS